MRSRSVLLIAVLVYSCGIAWAMAAGHCELPIAYGGTTWTVRVPSGQEGAVTLRYVGKPDAVRMADGGVPVPFSHENGALSFSVPASVEGAGDRNVEIVWPPNRWEEAIREIEKRDAREMPPMNAVLFVGSSSIRGWDVKKSFPEFEVVNRGFGGSQFFDAVCYADRVIFPYRPRAIVVYDGDNDIASGKSAEWVLADCAALIAAIRAKLPDTPIFLLAIKTSKARWEFRDEMRRANSLMQTLADEAVGVTFVDVDTPLLDSEGVPREAFFRDDRLHLNDDGYAVWNAIMKPLLDKMAR